MDESVLTFKEGVKNYLYNSTESFKNNLQHLANLELESDSIRKEIEHTLYTQSLMPQLRGDIMKLLEEMDNIIDLSKKSVPVWCWNAFDTIISHQWFLKLTQISASAAESVIPAAKSYFNDPSSVNDKIHRVYFYEKETDVLADMIRRKVFREMPELKLAEKFHLRYFTLHIENISDNAEKVADLLTIMAIKEWYKMTLLFFYLVAYF